MADRPGFTNETYLSAVRLALQKNKPDYELVAGKRSTTINELMGGCLEDRKIAVGQAPIFTFRFDDAEQRTNVLAVISCPLNKDRVLRFLNKPAPVKRDLRTPSEVARWSGDVGNDWAYMVSQLTVTRTFRHDLEKKHAPDSVPGFSQFRPHVKSWLGALGDEEVEQRFPTNPVRKPIMPLIHFRISPDGQLEWLDNMVTPEVHAAILKGVAQRTWNLQVLNAIGSSTLDKFAGLAAVPYAEPHVARLWETEQMGQPMSIAQTPVLVWQKKDDFNLNTRFVGGLAKFAALNN